MKNFTQDELDNLMYCPKRIIEAPRREMKLVNGSYRNDMKLEEIEGEHKFTAFMRVNAEFQERFSIGMNYDPLDVPGKICIGSPQFGVLAYNS